MMKFSKVFLRAEWRNLILANYEFDRTILKNYLPFKTEFDSWNGKDYISLVGFLFKNTRLKGMKIPYHITFEEVNLRFYVRYKENNEWKRGVVFIKEIVPRKMIALIANTIYHENYISCKMSHQWKEQGDILKVHYAWKNKNTENMIAINAKNKKMDIAVDTGEEFFTEHYYGYSRFDEARTGEYKVEHPRWKVFPVIEYNISCNFESNYGSEFKLLSGMKPDSIYLAEGSAIKVFDKVLLAN